MKKLLFVCLGNICRSPAAESITKKIISKKNIQLMCDSAGVLDYHKGDLAHPMMLKTLKARGYDAPSRSRPFEFEDFQLFDHIAVMDNQNYKDIKKRDRDGLYCDKLVKIAKYSQGVDEIPDPYYGTHEDFERVVMLLEEACEKMLMDFRYLK